MKTLVTQKQYSVNVTSAGSFSANFNLNTRDWHLLDGRINTESSSQSFLAMKFPPAVTSGKRPYSIRYGLSCTSNIPGVPVAEIENYPAITGNLNTSSDKWVNFPVNTEKMADFSFSPSNVYGYTIVDTDIYPYIAQGSQYWNDQYILLQIMPSWKTPTVSNIAVSGTDPRQNITISWDANIQDLVDVIITQGGVTKATLTGSTGKSIVMPANTVTAGAYTVQVIAANNPVDDLGVTGTASANFTATLIAPTVSAVAVNQTEIRNPITVSWDSTNQTDYIVEFIQGGTVKTTLTGATQTSATLGANILSEGAATVRVTVRNTAGGVSSTAVATYDFTGTVSRPVITSLEPDGVNQNVNSPINIAWNATLQETYTLTVRQFGSVLQVFNGTTAQSLTLPANTAVNGLIDLELICRNTVNGAVATTIRTAQFLGFGKPQMPIFENVDIYNSATPVINWTSSEQVAYEFSIYQNESLVETSGQVTSQNKSYTVTQVLSNNNTYTLKLRIKNQYDLWSDLAVKNIYVSYTVLTKPTLELVSGAGGILVNGLCADEPGFMGAEIWRRDDYSNFVRIGVNFGKVVTVTDTFVASNQTYYYKIRVTSTEGGITESDVKSASAYVDYVTIENIATKERMTLPYLINIDFETIVDIQYRNYAGLKKPRIHRGEVEYQTANIAVAKDKTNEIKLKRLLLDADVLLLRDSKGAKMYCGLSSSIANSARQRLTYNDIEFSLTEVEFIEKDMYSGGVETVLTYFDGTWMFDGTIDFSGMHTIGV